jgi:hypothetical protein
LSRKEDVCPHCGKSIQDDRGLEQSLERLGITADTYEYLQAAHHPRRVVLFPTEDGTLDRRQLEDAITHAMAKK